MLFYDNLKSICDKKNIKITPLIAECGGAKGSISNWKKGASPNSEIITKLSVRLNVSTDYLLTGKEKSSPTDLTADERELLTYYKKLPKEQQFKTMGRLEALAEIYSQVKEEPEQLKCKTIFIEIYNLPVSAGTGIYLDGEDKDMIKVPLTSLTEKANFALRIKGDSMTPKYDDGDIILIETQPCVDIDEIGVFILNGKGYVKKFKGDRLESCNENYPDIIINEFDSCYCKGKIIGKL